MIYHRSENQQSFDTDSSPVVFLEPLQWRAQCDGKLEHLVMTRALNLVWNLVSMRYLCKKMDICLVEIKI